jgi:hypothetical protein
MKALKSLSARGRITPRKTFRSAAGFYLALYEVQGAVREVNSGMSGRRSFPRKLTPVVSFNHENIHGDRIIHECEAKTTCHNSSEHASRLRCSKPLS